MSTEEQTECDCCRAKNVPLVLTKHAIKRDRSDETEAMYCELCRGTMASTWHHYREQYKPSDNDDEILKTIYYVGNTILKAIADLK